MIARLACAVVLAGATLAEPAFAQHAKPAGPDPDAVKKALGLSIYVQGGYTYNGNASNADTAQGEENDLRVFDHKANSFTLDLAQIVISRDTTAIDDSGFKVKLSTGEIAKWIHARGLSGAPLDQAQTGQGTDAIDLTEAYVSYLAPIGRGLRFDFGKMVTYFGSEVIEAKDDANYSRSFLFDFAIPFTHTGLKTSYALSAALSASFYVVNGWDNADDNNGGKSLGVGIGYAPSETFAGYVNIMTGPERNNNSGDKRTLTDLVAIFKPSRKVFLILNADYGTEENAVAEGTAAWSGMAGIAKYDINKTYSVAARAEIFNDRDGFRTGTAQTLTELTVTPEIRLAGGLVVRPEYRHDSSNRQSFHRVNGAFTRKSQDTIALGVMYAW
ncbi:MAG TPA: porin [Nitrospirota bacterium]|nr:porin [Nitrospirota bacterium]